ncbi:MAG: GMC family oxidoreductase N-terminal domain-containing protein, partial [Polyangiaceae bacterium]
MKAEPVTRGREVTAPFQAKCDVVVIGSGAGGAVVARELSRAGHSVIVLEEGGYYTPAEYGAMTPSNSLRRLAREAGFAAAVAIGETPFISLMSGKCVGGSSVLTGGVCFRIPDAVLHEWSTDLGLTDLSPEKLDPYFSEVERAIQVETVPESMRSRSTELFVEGADKLGIKMKSLRRNTHGCRGASRCNFGCPHGAKMSVDISYLPDALANGTHILSDALVQKIEISGGRATGVVGKFLDPITGEPKIPFYVRAKAVVVACGSLHTPVLLRKSGLDSPHIGRHLTLHPAFRVCALFDEYVGGWDGSMQSAYSDHFQDEGITLVSAYSAASILAAAFPGSGKDHYRIAAELPRLGVFGGMIHDEGMGQVRRWIS